MAVVLVHLFMLALAVVAGVLFHKRRARSRLPRERTEAETSLIDEKAFTQAILDSLPGIFYVYDYPTLRMVRWNKNHERAFGFTAEELDGKGLLSWHPRDVWPAVRAAVESAMSSGTNAIEGRLLAKDGSLIPYLMTGTAFKSGGRDYLVGVGIDISDRVRAREELQSLNADLEKRIAERTGELEATLRNLRETQEQTLLSEKMADLGRLVAGLAHELNTPLGAILSAGETSSIAVRQTADVFDFYRSLDESDAEIFMSMVTEVRANKALNGSAAERRLRREYEQALAGAGIAEPTLAAEQLVESGFSGGREKLIAMASSPRFTRIADSVYRLSTIVRSNAIILSAAEKAAKVISALKTYSRQDLGNNKSSADVRAQLDLVLTILGSKLKGGIEVVREYQDVPPVSCYPERLDQVWMNLITNAVQAMNYKGKLELKVANDAGGVEVSVIDSGAGIPEEIRDKIFRPFFTTKPKGEGTGLGLDICKRILDEIGGSIGFESEKGRTCFTVRLKAAGTD